MEDEVEKILNGEFQPVQTSFSKLSSTEEKLNRKKVSYGRSSKPGNVKNNSIIVPISDERYEHITVLVRPPASQDSTFSLTPLSQQFALDEPTENSLSNPLESNETEKNQTNVNPCYVDNFLFGRAKSTKVYGENSSEKTTLKDGKSKDYEAKTEHLSSQLILDEPNTIEGDDEVLKDKVDIPASHTLVHNVFSLEFEENDSSSIVEQNSVNPVSDISDEVASDSEAIVLDQSQVVEAEENSTTEKSQQNLLNPVIDNSEKLVIDSEAHISDQSQDAEKPNVNEEDEKISEEFEGEETSFSNETEKDVSNHNRYSSSDESDVEETSTSTTAPEATKYDSDSKRAYPSDEEILNETESMFQIVNMDEVTVGDIIRALEEKYSVPFDIRIKVIIRQRLQKLVSETNDDSSSDGSDAGNTTNVEESDKKKSVNARKRKKNLKESGAVRPERQRERVMQEEMNEAGDQQLSEEEKKIMEAISERFRTDTNESRIKRQEDYDALMEKLKNKKMESMKFNVNVSLDESDEESDEELELIPKAKLSKETSVKIMPSNKHKLFNSRASLRNAIRYKKKKAGNNWLARELGYKNDREHIKDCRRYELKRKFLMQKQEEKNVRHGYSTFSDNKSTEHPNEDNELENEEIQQAKLIAEENEESLLKGEKKAELKSLDECVEEKPEIAYETENKLDNPNDVEHYVQSVKQYQSNEESNEKNNCIAVNINFHVPNDEKSAVESHISGDTKREENKSLKPLIEKTYAFENTVGSALTNSLTRSYGTVYSGKGEEDEALMEEREFDDNPEPKPESKEKNARWKALIEKESKRRIRKTSLIDAEAEEEEEENVAGLEDFGFKVFKGKQKENEEEHDSDSDFSNIVDDVSDNEGDEELGRKARADMATKEEKQRHKEIIRRMRDGYDGRRGGIASSIHNRGVHRFDQLVAADNRADAKKLGLLNADELDDSDDEKETKEDNDEEEDEAVLVDKMLRDRFQRKDDIFLDLPSEDEDEESVTEGVGNVKDLKEKENDRIAKQFQKRAIMNRIMEEYNDMEEFSHSRLIDQEVSIDLKSIRTVHSMTRSSTITSLGTDSNTQDSRALQLSQNSQSENESKGKKSSLFSMAIRTNEGRKRKSTFQNKDGSSKKRKTFLGGTGFSSSTSSHVLFHSQGSTLPMPSTQFKRKTSIDRKAKELNRSPQTRSSSGSSLWSRVSANRFRNRR